MPRADYAAGIDTFSLIVVVGLVLMVLAVLALGQFYPGSGAEQLDWKPTRSPQVEAENEIDDVAQMLEAQNERRRRRGLPDRTEEEIAAEVRRDHAELKDRAAAFRAREGQPPEEQALARVLIIGCGGRGQTLARELADAGHAVRGTTRDPARAGAIAAAGAEPCVGDPDRIATLMEA